jgi:hypothetical protein
MKRMTDTDKWGKPWWRKLTKAQRWLWLWLLDNCDASGVVDFTLEWASAVLEEKLTQEDVKALEKQLEPRPDGKYWIRDFIAFQYRVLSQVSPGQNKVFADAKKNGINLKPYLKEEVAPKAGTTAAAPNSRPASAPVATGGNVVPHRTSRFVTDGYSLEEQKRMIEEDERLRAPAKTPEEREAQLARGRKTMAIMDEQTRVGCRPPPPRTGTSLGAGTSETPKVTFPEAEVLRCRPLLQHVKNICVDPIIHGAVTVTPELHARMLAIMERPDVALEMDVVGLNLDWIIYSPKDAVKILNEWERMVSDALSGKIKKFVKPTLEQRGQYSKEFKERWAAENNETNYDRIRGVCNPLLKQVFYRWDRIGPLAEKAQAALDQLQLKPETEKETQTETTEVTKV